MHEFQVDQIVKAKQGIGAVPGRIYSHHVWKDTRAIVLEVSLPSFCSFRAQRRCYSDEYSRCTGAIRVQFIDFQNMTTPGIKDDHEDMKHISGRFLCPMDFIVHGKPTDKEGE